jgi:hypothetical protein
MVRIPNPDSNLQEAAEDTEKLILPRITRISADWMPADAS